APGRRQVPPPTARGPRLSPGPSQSVSLPWVLTDQELALHPRMDEAHEVLRGALLRRHVQVLREALLGLDERRVAGPVEVRRGVLADAVLQEVELRRRVA